MGGRYKGKTTVERTDCREKRGRRSSPSVQYKRRNQAQGLDIRMFNSVKAVGVGVATDVFGTFSFGVVLTLVVGTFGGLESASLPVVRGAVYQAMSDGSYVMLSLIGGLLFTLCGGFRAARIANKLPLVHAGIVGVAATIVSAPVATSGMVVWTSVAGVVSAMPAALVGGAFGARPPRHTRIARGQLNRTGGLQ